MIRNKFFTVIFVLILAVPPVFAEENSLRYPDFAKEYLGQDRFEKFNRRMFNFNQKLNKYALRPLHVIWASVMPKYGMERIQSAYTNIEYPKRLASCLLQKDFKGSGRETLRFLANSTLGVGGMFDPAKKFFKLEPLQEDLDQGLSKCKMKSGPYLVLPVMSSTTPRAALGKIIETGLDPTTYVAPPIGSVVRMGLMLNRTSLMQPLSVFLERTFADPYDITKKIYGMERYIRLSNLDRRENLQTTSEATGKVLNEDDTLEGTNMPNEENKAVNDASEPADDEHKLAANEEILKGGAAQEETLEKTIKEAVQSSVDLTPDIFLPDYNPQSPVVDSMRTALFELPGINESIWSELSVWNRSFSKRIKAASVPLFEGRADYKFRYIMQKDKSSPLVILYPSIGEGLMAHHSVILAKIFYDAGYSVLIQGSHFHFEFIKSMPEGYRPGLPSKDAEQLRLATGKAIEYLQNKYETEFRSKTLMGTSFGALMTLFVASAENNNPSLKISKYISVNPPIELTYAIKELDKNNDEWNKNPSNLKHKTAVTAAKVLDLYNQKGENPNFKIETLPFSDYEGKLITGFVLRQKLSDLIFAIENTKNTDKAALYNSINNTSYADYVKKYLLNGGISAEELAYNSSLYSISDYLKSADNYTIYHTLDDYFTNKSQLKKLKDYTGRNTVLFSNGGHLGYMYRPEFLDHLNSKIRLNENIAVK